MANRTDRELGDGRLRDDRVGRAKAEADLAASEEQFRMFVGGVKDYAIFLLDPSGVVVSWNPGAERIKGYKAEEIIGRHFSTFYPQDAIDRGWPEEELRRATADGRIEDEGWRLRKDGLRFWANVVITALRDDAGVLRGFGKVTRDLTERRKAEDQLRASEERFRMLVGGVRDYAIFMLDPHGYVMTWNAGAERIKGYKAEEIVGRHFSAFYTPEDLAGARTEKELKIAAHEGAYEEEGWRVRKDGSRFWASVVITALRDESGMLRGFSKVTRDVTERRESERIRSIVDNVVDGIITFDENGIIESLNPAAEKIFGYRSEELLGRHVGLLDSDPAAADWSATPGEGGGIRELSGRRKDGNVFAIDLAVGTFHFQGRRAYTAVVRDIRQRRESEEQLRFYAQELQQINAALAQSNQELDEFAYIASHDLKEPLRGIHNYSTFLLEDYGETLDADGKTKLETLSRLAQRMEGLINSLLEFSRVGRVELATQPTDLNDVVRRAQDTLQITLNESRAEVRMPRPMPTIVCDQVRVAEVFQNLIANAVKYNDKPEKWVEVGYQGGGKETVLYVKDNGIGIPQKHIEVVFRLFKRLHGRDKFGGGTGVGLTIVKKIIERHGGRIWLQSSPGEGSTFFFTLGTKEER